MATQRADCSPHPNLRIDKCGQRCTSGPPQYQVGISTLLGAGTHCLLAGPTRRGVGGTMILGLMDFRGPTMGPVGFRGPSKGPIEMTQRNQYVEDRRPFFCFGDHIKIRKKLWHFSVKTFFGGEKSHQNPDKTVAFSPSVLEFTKQEMHNI